MTGTRDYIQFLLNDRVVKLEQPSATLTLLDFLRLDQHLRGTKEGCAEGDCGACTVLVGRLLDGNLIYETVNSCIRFVGSLNACHVVSIEHLKGVDGKLHPVQRAMVDYHGSQCGFCTPGIVMSLYALWMQTTNPTVTEIETALQGNLCRCTGYEPIIKAALNISKYGEATQDKLTIERAQIIKHLKSLQSDETIEIKNGDDHLIVPNDLDDFAAVRQKYPNSTIVAGSTDVGLWVTKQFRTITPTIFIDHLDELKQIEVTDHSVRIGAGVSYSQLIPIVKTYIPDSYSYWMRIGGEQVRNMGTIGGNIANGSPIGDTPPMLIALGAMVTLQKGLNKRTLPLEDFFIDYGKQDRQIGDFVESITIPFSEPKSFFRTYKISKRRDEDISAVTLAARLYADNQVITKAVVALGGMAGIPKRASHVEASLVGKPFDLNTFDMAAEAIAKDFAPLSDWRASADYRTLVAKNLIKRLYVDISDKDQPTSIHQMAFKPATALEASS